MGLFQFIIKRSQRGISQRLRFSVTNNGGHGGGGRVSIQFDWFGESGVCVLRRHGERRGRRRRCGSIGRRVHSTLFVIIIFFCFSEIIAQESVHIVKAIASELLARRRGILGLFEFFS